MTTTIAVRIPNQFRSILNVSPDDMTLRLVIADWYAEQGELLAEELMRWSVAKGRVPSAHAAGWNWWYWNERTLGYSSACYLPDDWYSYGNQRLDPPTDDSRSISTTFDQLIVAWERMEEHRRKEWWEWKPE